MEVRPVCNIGAFFVLLRCVSGKKRSAERIAALQLYGTARALESEFFLLDNEATDLRAKIKLDPRSTVAESEELKRHSQTALENWDKVYGDGQELLETLQLHLEDYPEVLAINATTVISSLEIEKQWINKSIKDYFNRLAALQK